MDYKTRDAAIYRLWLQGTPYKDITKRYGIPLGTAYRIVHYQKQAKAKQIAPPAPVKRRQCFDASRPRFFPSQPKGLHQLSQNH